jgi:ankyrin repeat protein
MTQSDTEDRQAFREAADGLLRGDFSRLSPLFEDQKSRESPCPILTWFEKGWFDTEPAALHEALTCACFLGQTGIVAFLLEKGVDPLRGSKTGSNGFHWAAGRGQLDTVKLLIEHRVPLEVKNMYGGTVLGTAVWSAIHEPRIDHFNIIEALLRAGARIEATDYPSGDPRVDDLLRRYGETF